MLKSIEVYHSKEVRPEFNLAFEEYLLEQADQERMVLFLWQNEKTVVIGRHQNPYKECDLQKMKRDSVKLVRRLSGGGAVYHDLGNLNFTFIGSTKHYDVQKQMDVILKAIETLGLKGEASGRNDLTIDGRKFSGNAFINKDGRHCHHGTLLMDVDIDKLSTYLTVSEHKIKSKGIESVRSRVVNLKELCPQMNLENLKHSLIQAFNQMYQLEATIKSVEDNVQQEVFEAYMEKYHSWEWNYGQSPSFEWEMSTKFSWGLFEMSISTANGCIEKCYINTDALVDEPFEKLQGELHQKPLAAGDFIAAIKTHIKNPTLQSDLCHWIRDHFAE